MYTYKTNINTSLRFAKIHCGRDACSDPAFDKGLRTVISCHFQCGVGLARVSHPNIALDPKDTPFFC